jgi:hypothetical protein
MADLQNILGQVLQGALGSMTGGINPLQIPAIAGSAPDAMGHLKQLGTEAESFPGSSAIPAALEMGTGGNISDHMEAAKGDAQFSQLPIGSGHHASAAEEGTKRLGFGNTMGGGLLMELVEDALGTENAGLTGDTLNDLKANVVGGVRGAGFPGVSQGIQDALPDANPESTLQEILQRMLSGQ